MHRGAPLQSPRGLVRGQADELGGALLEGVARVAPADHEDTEEVVAGDDRLAEGRLRAGGVEQPAARGLRVGLVGDEDGTALDERGGGGRRLVADADAVADEALDRRGRAVQLLAAGGGLDDRGDRRVGQVRGAVDEGLAGVVERGDVLGHAAQGGEVALLAGEARLDRATLRDVGAGRQRARDDAVVVADDRDDPLDEADGAVGAQHAVVDLVAVGVAGLHRAEALAARLAVVGGDGDVEPVRADELLGGVPERLERHRVRHADPGVGVDEEMQDARDLEIALDLTAVPALAETDHRVRAPVGDQRGGGAEDEQPVDEGHVPRVGVAAVVAVDQLRPERAHDPVLHDDVGDAESEDREVLVQREDAQHHEVVEVHHHGAVCDVHADRRLGEEPERHRARAAAGRDPRRCREAEGDQERERLDGDVGHGRTGRQRPDRERDGLDAEHDEHAAVARGAGGGIELGARREQTEDHVADAAAGDRPGGASPGSSVTQLWS